jgi:hypothetical protein
MTEGDLKDLGFPMGPRKLLFRYISSQQSARASQVDVPFPVTPSSAASNSVLPVVTNTSTPSGVTVQAQPSLSTTSSSTASPSAVRADEVCRIMACLFVRLNIGPCILSHSYCIHVICIILIPV